MGVGGDIPDRRAVHFYTSLILDQQALLPPSPTLFFTRSSAAPVQDCTLSRSRWLEADWELYAVADVPVIQLTKHAHKICKRLRAMSAIWRPITGCRRFSCSKTPLISTGCKVALVGPEVV